MNLLPSCVSLYIHIPFCSTLCPFCDFTKLTVNDARFQDYITACCNEIKHYYKTPKIQLTSIFFGGGTPSLLPTLFLKQLLKTVQATFDCSDLQEITLEANPEDISKEYLQALSDLKVTRISLGVQTFNDDECKFLGRGHTTKQSHEALKLIKSFSFDLNIDLMFGLPNTSIKNLHHSLNTSVMYNPTHISTYSLTIEPGTLFFRDNVKKATSDEDYTYYSYIIDFLTQHHFFQYEVSSFAKPGYECLHNKRYWQFEPYIGVGLGAHSLLNSYRYHTTSSLHNYLKDSTPVIFKPQSKPLSQADLIKENIIANLRTPTGIIFKEYHDRYNFNFLEKYEKQITQLVKDGLIKKTAYSLQTTKKGLYLLDNVCLSFL